MKLSHAVFILFANFQYNPVGLGKMYIKAAELSSFFRAF